MVSVMDRIGAFVAALMLVVAMPLVFPDRDPRTTAPPAGISGWKF